MKAIGVFAAVALLAVAVFGEAAAAAAAEPCAPVGKLHFICGTNNSEDLVQVPGTKWLIASGMSGPGIPVGHLHLIDSRSKSWEVLFPTDAPELRQDKDTYGDCPGAPDLTKFGAHGLNLRPGGGGKHTLYVVNHGGREAIEVFALDASGGEPKLTWIGCAVMPPHAWPNSVASLPDGGIVVTKMFDPDDKQLADKLADGVVTGAVYEWHPRAGFTLVPDSEMSGNNGIEASRDGKWIYVAAWGKKEVVRLSHSAATPGREALPAGFQVDNLRWAPDGALIVAGQDVPAKEVFGCFESQAPRCTQPWRILAWDTAAMKLRPVASDQGDPGFGDATVGLRVGNEVYVGTFRGDRIAYLTVE
jgi:hypothetical protein